MKMGFVFIAIVSAIGIVGRPSFGYVADKIGHQNTFLFGITVCALSTLALWLPAAAIGSKSLWLAFIVLWGLANGSFLQLTNSVSKNLFGDELYYSYSGAFTTARGIGLIVGNPVGGALTRRVRDDELGSLDFYPAIIYAGIALLISSIGVVWVRWLDARRNGWK